jgi:ammonium transporter, Amt family
MSVISIAVNETGPASELPYQYISRTYQQCADQYEDYRAANEVVTNQYQITKDFFLVQCASNSLQVSSEAQNRDLHNWYLVLFGAQIFFMQTGFAALCAGSIRPKNVLNTMLKNLLDACLAVLTFYAIGFGLAFGGQDEESNLGRTSFVGTTGFFLMNLTSSVQHTVGQSYAFFFFQYSFCAATVTIVAGALSERCQTTGYLLYSVALTGFVYPVVAHAVWSNQGFLSATNPDPLWGVGALDFAGGGTIHYTGGLVALIAAVVLGPRRGRFYDAYGRKLVKPVTIKGSSVALQIMGTMILWFGCKYP